MHYTTSCNTQSGAPEDGRNYRPKHVELIGIINKPLLLYNVGCLYYRISDARSYKPQVQTSAGAFSASYSMGTKGSFHRGKDNNSSPSAAKVKNGWRHTSILPTCFYRMDRDSC